MQEPETLLGRRRVGGVLTPQFLGDLVSFYLSSPLILSLSHFFLFLNTGSKSFKTIFEQGICVCVTWLLLLLLLLSLLKRIIIINKDRKDNKKVLEEKDTTKKEKAISRSNIVFCCNSVCVGVMGRMVEPGESTVFTTATDRISKYINIFALLVVNER